MQHLQLHPPPNIVEQQQSQNHTSNGNDENTNAIKDGKSTPEPESESKLEDKSEPENNHQETNSQRPEQSQALSQQISMQMPQIQFTTGINTLTAIPPPIMTGN